MTDSVFKKHCRPGGKRVHADEHSALTGRASALRASDHLHAMSLILCSAACIFRAQPNLRLLAAVFFQWSV